jgi:hypothetical protein
MYVLFCSSVQGRYSQTSALLLAFYFKISAAKKQKEYTQKNVLAYECTSVCFVKSHTLYDEFLVLQCAPTMC